MATPVTSSAAFYRQFEADLARHGVSQRMVRGIFNSRQSNVPGRPHTVAARAHQFRESLGNRIDAIATGFAAIAMPSATEFNLVPRYAKGPQAESDVLSYVAGQSLAIYRFLEGTGMVKVTAENRSVFQFKEPGLLSDSGGTKAIFDRSLSHSAETLKSAPLGSSAEFSRGYSAAVAEIRGWASAILPASVGRLGLGKPGERWLNLPKVALMADAMAAGHRYIRLAVSTAADEIDKLPDALTNAFMIHKNVLFVDNELGRTINTEATLLELDGVCGLQPELELLNDVLPDLVAAIAPTGPWLDHLQPALLRLSPDKQAKLIEKTLVAWLNAGMGSDGVPPAIETLPAGVGTAVHAALGEASSVMGRGSAAGVGR